MVDAENENYDEEESVYMKDGVLMKKIQIEGEDEEYLMDDEGNIYDMRGNFIGTAKTDELWFYIFELQNSFKYPQTCIF